MGQHVELSRYAKTRAVCFWGPSMYSAFSYCLGVARRIAWQGMLACGWAPLAEHLHRRHAAELPYRESYWMKGLACRTPLAKMVGMMQLHGVP